MTSQNNNTDTELYRFASAYMDKLELMTREVTNACNQISNVKIKLDDLEKELSSKKRFVWLKWLSAIIPILVIILPVLTVVVLIFFGKYVPCGEKIEFGDIKLIAPECDVACKN
jgi:hypothetical protein